MLSLGYTRKIMCEMYKILDVCLRKDGVCVYFCTMFRFQLTFSFQLTTCECNFAANCVLVNWIIPDSIWKLPSYVLEL